MNQEISSKIADVLIDWAGERINNAKAILTKFEATTGVNNLYNSIAFNAPEIESNKISIGIGFSKGSSEDANKYFMFVDEGVKGIGFASQKSTARNVRSFGSKASAFGNKKTALTTGRFKFKNPYVGRKMVNSISEWIAGKPILIRTTKEQKGVDVLKRNKSVAFAIAKNIKRTGIGKTMFWSDTFNDKEYQILANRIAESLGGEYEVQFNLQ